MSIRRSLAALSGLLLVMPFANCGCEEDLERAAPIIRIVDPFDLEASPCAEDFAVDCSYDFGDVAIGEGRFFKFLIQSQKTVALSVTRLAIVSSDPEPPFALADVKTVEDNDACAQLTVKPEDITPDNPLTVPVNAHIEDTDNCQGQYTEVTVRFTPKFASGVTATIEIDSDAVNPSLTGDGEGEEDDDQQGPQVTTVRIDITGNGLDLGRPQIVVTPEQCNFGEIGTLVAAFCDVQIENAGTRDLVVDSLALTEGTPAAINDDGVFDTELDGFGIQSLVILPTFIAPGTGQAIRVFANPVDEQLMEGTLRIESNDPVAEVVDVPLSVRGAVAPTAIARVKSVNGVPNSNPSPIVKPLDDVILSGDESVGNSANTVVIEWHWEIIDAPATSTAELTDPDSVETGFFFNSSDVDRPGLDVAGTYIIALTVVDEDGLVSSNNATVTLNANPQESLHLELTWDSASYDYDLHVIRNGGPYCSQNSCYFANCNVNNAGIDPPEWDGVAGDTSGDPTLDIDDLSGYGPENINIDTPDDGVYRVAVHAYSGIITEPVLATLKIFINGGLSYEEVREMSEGKDFWEVAEVEWANGAAIVYPVDEYDTDWSCFSF